MTPEDLIHVGSNLPEKDYQELLATVKEHIQTGRTKAALAVNNELVVMNWFIGRDLLARQEKEGWGARVIDQLSADLRSEGHRGFSERNLKYMRAFAAAWPNKAIVQGCLAQLSWYHNLRLLGKLDNTADRLWYAEQAIANGWNSDTLVNFIENDLKESIGKAPTNFALTMPKAQSELAQEVVRSKLNLEFLRLTANAREKDIEDALIGEVSRFLLELGGYNWTFVGSQIKIVVGEQEFYPDLLFFHRRLNRLIVVDLKIGTFKPQDAGQMVLYQKAIDANLREEHEEKCIGIILCKEADRMVAQYTVEGMANPMAVTEYQLGSGEELPPELQAELPAISEISAGVEKVLENAPSESEKVVEEEFEDSEAPHTRSPHQ